MPLGAQDDFSTDELALIPPPDPDEQPLPGDEPPQPSTTGGASENSTPPQEQQQQPPAAAAPAPAAAPAEQDKPKGDVRAALRAARRSEQQWREQAQQLKQQLDEALAKLPANARPEDSTQVTDEELATLEVDYPVVAKAVRLAKQAAEAVSASAPAATQQAAAEFMPPYLPPEFQEAVDEVPDLLAWQHDPDQSRFEAAKKVDAYLFGLAAWKDKPLTERLAEVARRVNADLGHAPAPAPQRADPAAVIANLERPAPSTLSDLQGGSGKEPPPASNVQRYAGMSEEQILADLLRGG